MNTKVNWLRIAQYAGVAAVIAGALDPLEGSVVILAGSIILAIVHQIKHDPQRKWFLLAAAMIVVGVFFLFYFSNLGGFGGSSTLSWWWGMLILPYPIGWLVLIILLIWRAVQHRRLQHVGPAETKS